MADTVVTQEELALRRRARRRLVGAVAIALSAFVLLPMLFDPDPKPLGPEVDLRIPARDTPFDAGAQVQPAEPAAPQLPEPPPQIAEPTLPATTARMPDVVASKPTPPAATPPAPVVTPPPARALPAPTAAPMAPAATSPREPPTVTRVAPAPSAPSAAAEERAPADGDTRVYYLQLGAFGSEANASTLARKVREAGFDVLITGGNGQYRVRVGPVRGQEAARALQNRLRERGFTPVILSA